MARGPAWLGGYRDLPDGGQRFVVMDQITDGCRACAVVATAVSFADFRDGALESLSPWIWVAPDVALEGDAAAAALGAGNAAVLQYRLLVAGYDAGGTDGVTGPRTLAALDSHLADHCLPSRRDEPEVRAEAIAVLAGLVATRCEAPAAD